MFLGPPVLTLTFSILGAVVTGTIAPPEGREYTGPKTAAEREPREYTGVLESAWPSAGSESPPSDEPTVPQLIGRGPLPSKTVFRPNRVLALPGFSQAPGIGCYGEHIAFEIQQKAFNYLDGPIELIASYRS